MYQDDTCEMISQSNHSFNIYDPHYVYHWMKPFRFCVEILAASDTESDDAIRCTWLLSLYL